MPRRRMRRLGLGSSLSLPPPKLPPYDPPPGEKPKLQYGTRFHEQYVQFWQETMHILDAWPLDIKQWVWENDLNPQEVLQLALCSHDEIRRRMRNTV